MDINVSFQTTLTEQKNHLSLDGPCVCCNNPAVENFTYHKEYPLSVWAANTNRKTGQRTLTKAPKKNNDGKDVMGLFEFDLPYCQEHLDQTKKLHKMHDNQNKLVMWLGVGVVVAFLLLGGFSWGRSAETTVQFGTRLCAMPILIFLGSSFIFKFSIDSRNNARANQPEFMDFPIDSQSGGGSGIGIEIIEEPTQGTKNLGIDVKNYLHLDFKNIETAKRFKEKYPHIKVKKGQSFL